MTEDEMVGWHHQFNRHEFGQTPGDGKGQGSLACCSPWGCRDRHDLATEQQHMIPPIMALLKRQNYGNSEKINGCQERNG